MSFMQVRRLWASATQAYMQALQHAKEAITWAEDNYATQTVVGVDV